jgi:hypothetical protein
VIRVAARSIALLRAFIRLRDARPRIRIKPFWAKRFAGHADLSADSPADLSAEALAKADA